MLKKLKMQYHNSSLQQQTTRVKKKLLLIGNSDNYLMANGYRNISLR